MDYLQCIRQHSRKRSQRDYTIVLGEARSESVNTMPMQASKLIRAKSRNSRRLN